MLSKAVVPPISQLRVLRRRVKVMERRERHVDMLEKRDPTFKTCSCIQRRLIDAHTSMNEC